MIREFFAGVRILGRGFGMWRTHPKLLALGLIPAFIAWALLLAALIPLGFTLGPITDWITPFADGWVSPWRETLRIGLGLVIFIAALALAGAVFTALTLTIGDPFYQRIWRGVERSLGDEPTGETGFWTTVGEGIRLVVLGILVALLTLVIGFLPLVGGVLASVAGLVLSGRLLARELTGRAFDARGLTAYSRSELLGAGRARVIGFGVATQLCFLIPLGAIVAMPAAVAGSTLLAHGLIRRAHPAPPPPEVSLDAAPALPQRHEATPPTRAPSAPADAPAPPQPEGSLGAASTPSQRHEATPPANAPSAPTDALPAPAGEGSLDAASTPATRHEATPPANAPSAPADAPSAPTDAPAPPQPEGSLGAASTPATRHEATPPTHAPSAPADAPPTPAGEGSLDAASTLPQRHEATPPTHAPSAPTNAPTPPAAAPPSGAPGA